MMVRIIWGSNSTIEPPFIIFKNEDHSYPIRSCPDNIPDVLCRNILNRSWTEKVCPVLQVVAWAIIMVNSQVSMNVFIGN